MVKKLAGYVKEYTKTAVITPVLVLMEVVLEIVIPLIMAELIDNGIDGGSMPAIVRYGITLLVAALMMLFFGIAAGRTASVASSGFAKNLREAMYNRVQEFSFANIDHFSTASIVTRLTTDVTNVQMAFQMCTRIATRAPGMLIFALIAAFRIDAKLSLVYVALLPVLAIGLFILIKIAYPVFDRMWFRRIFTA